MEFKAFRELAKFFKGLGGIKKQQQQQKHASGMAKVLTTQHTRTAGPSSFLSLPGAEETTFPSGPQAASGAARWRYFRAHLLRQFMGPDLGLRLISLTWVLSFHSPLTRSSSLRLPRPPPPLSPHRSLHPERQPLQRKPLYLITAGAVACSPGRG